MTVSPAIDDAGLFIGARVRLARFARHGGLALDAEGPRVLALLSVAAERAVPGDVLAPIIAASDHWRRGDKALANIRLVQARLPRITSAIDARNVGEAADLLDGGLVPGALMKALGFDAAALRKFNPGQPRVPAGSGPTGGQWANGSDAGATAARPRRSAPHLPIVPIGATGPMRPGGIAIVPHSGVDPLDPQDLNTPPSPAEQQAIAETVNTILAGNSQDLATLRPHPYENFPHPETNAQLPMGGSYTTHYVRSPGSPPGEARIITDADGSIYYTNNHYKSFYPVDVHGEVE